MKALTEIKITCFLGFCAFLIPELLGKKAGLSIKKEWKQLEYTYASDAERQQAIDTGEFNPKAGVPMDVDVHYTSSNDVIIFLTVPRLNNGVPSTLNIVSEEMRNGNPLLQPFPSWEWNRHNENCNQDRLISVFRVQLDECGRLWVLDTGKIGSEQLCPAQIIAFNPENGDVLHQYEIPSDQINSQSMLVTPVVDVRDPHNGCQDTFLYNADTTGFGLIVYDVKNRESWSIENKLFYPYPDYGTFNIAGESFDLMDGILGMALSPYYPETDRVLFFHSLASNTENYVYTSVIRNSSTFTYNAGEEPRKFNVFRNKRHSQAAGEAMDRSGILYFGAMTEISVMCWNTHTKFEQKNFYTVDANKTNLQFASGVKIVNNYKGDQELWISTNRLQKYYSGTVNANEINFRILAASTDQLIRGTKCDKE